MNRLLIAVKSCWQDKDRGCHTAIRETWGKDVDNHHADLVFFLGDLNRETSESDELVLNCPDDYDSLPFKTKEILQCMLAFEYTHCFLCDVDTFVIPGKLMTSGYEQYDYSGSFGCSQPPGVPYCYTDTRGNIDEEHYVAASGGVGYFLSRKAAKFIVQAEPKTWAEDLFVAHVLGPLIGTGEFTGEITARYLQDFEANVSWHFRRTTKYRMFQPEMQYEAYLLGNPTRMYDLERQELKEAREKRMGLR